ncbi:DUF1285 domain-containing protein [Limibaculum sp. M0105]|uniref:DUF1285 domain-containing protein n=1 Tax=Thermohalobaculum xanthum TaxID=2753746 RepID=A0A8J7MA27_9RHOB|nr:DUF1285 domain-containing protein [Thermohalobaculum xanthum]MBK0400372.1 DUF1285 domain-containing protein [Thermohalobaculum xanthum]
MVSDTKTDPGAADALAKAVGAATRGKKGPPPVHLWNPPYCGDLDIRIARNGQWWYLGTPIGRIELVELFASVLKLEDGKHYLVTPVEKIGITVDDAPFVAVDFRVENHGPGQVLVFETNVGDETAAGPENPIRVARDPQTGEPSPYVHVRRGLEALIDRKSFYRLVEIGEHEEIEGTRWFGLRSGGQFFPIIPSVEMEVEA